MEASKYHNRMIRRTAHEKKSMFDGFWEQHLDDSGKTNYIQDQNGDKWLNRKISGVILDKPDESLPDFEVSYSFSSGRRSNMFRSVTGKDSAYGGVYSYRMLYEMLCSHFNAGVYFIDSYLEDNFMSRPVYRDLYSMNNEIMSDIVRELKEIRGGTLHNLRGRFVSDGAISEAEIAREMERLSLGDFSVWKNEAMRLKLSRIGKAIRDDIIFCLQSGIVTLHKLWLSDETIKRRKRFSELEPNRIFYASGNLIKHLDLWVSVKEAA